MTNITRRRPSMKQTKKAAILAAGMAALALGPTSARAQSDAVTIYGFLKVDVESVWAGGAKGGQGRMGRVSNNLSVLGFKGVEDLGGGLQAFFQIESNVGVDTGAGSFADRNDNVGLRGSLGEIFAGQYETPYRFVSVYAIDPFTAGIFASNSIMGNGFTTAANAQSPASFDRRQKNLVQYSTPNFGGLVGKIAYAAREERTATSDPSLVSALLTYESGPLYLAYGHEQHKDYFSGGSVDTGNKIGGAYSFGNTRVRFVWERLRYEPAPGASLRRDAWQVALTHNVGNGQLRASYVRAERSKGNAAAGIGGIGKPGTASGAQQVSLGYGYSLSKRTELWGALTKIFNEQNASYNLSANPIPGLNAGQSPAGVGLGITHKF
ncbi:porin [Herbaspirillum robiniae]|uniref:Porin n=2 Tax=Herbaspirillum robiniae TaxID=2014887 RepID=A0ABX2LWR5_9BURK|nr:porin [Herbaspirillum robiniae]